LIETAFFEAEQNLHVPDKKRSEGPPLLACAAVPDKFSK
jgi:hypothetical protein